MPPLKATQVPLPPNYTRVSPPATPQAPPVAINPSLVPGLSPTMRCPVPLTAFNHDASTQFYRGGGIPQFRTFAGQPLSNNYNSGAVPISTTTTVESGGSTTPTPTIMTGSVATPVLNPGQSYLGVVTMPKVFNLISLSATAAARIRVYATRAAQISDNGRGITSALNFQTTQGVYADVNLTSSPFLWLMTPVPTLANGDAPTASVAYVTVNNDQATSTAIIVTLSYAAIVP